MTKQSLTKGPAGRDPRVNGIHGDPKPGRGQPRSVSDSIAAAVRGALESRDVARLLDALPPLPPDPPVSIHQIYVTTALPPLGAGVSAGPPLPPDPPVSVHQIYVTTALPPLGAGVSAGALLEQIEAMRADIALAAAKAHDEATRRWIFHCDPTPRPDHYRPPGTAGGPRDWSCQGCGRVIVALYGTPQACGCGSSVWGEIIGAGK